jgi:hypothetical protein
LRSELEHENTQLVAERRHGQAVSGRRQAEQRVDVFLVDQPAGLGVGDGRLRRIVGVGELELHPAALGVHVG